MRLVYALFFMYLLSKVFSFVLFCFVSSTGQTCPEGRSTNRSQVLCEVLHPTLSRKTREIDHNTGNYVVVFVVVVW